MIAEIVTFDIPDLDFESVLLPGDSLKCPENDEIFMDLQQETFSDKTIVGGYKWSELRVLLWEDPYFNRIAFMESLSRDDRYRYEVLANE